MFIKTRTIVIAGIGVLLLMVAEWRYVAWRTEIETVREFHGLCNTGVGTPYFDFVHQLRLIQESGDTNKLARVLRGADNGSHDISLVWLHRKPLAYKESLEKILK